MNLSQVFVHTRQWIGKRWLVLARAAIIAMVLGGSAQLALMAARGSRLPLMVIPAMLGILGMLVLMKYPYLGIIFMLCAGQAIPFSIGTGSETRLNISFVMVGALLGIWILDMFVSQRRIYLYRSITTLPALAICISVLLSFGFGQLHWFPVQGASRLAQIGGMMLFFFSAGAFLIVANQVPSINILQWMVWGFLIAGAPFVVGRAIFSAFPSTTPFFSRTTERFYQFGATGSLYWVWFMSLAFSQAVFNHHLKLHWRMMLLLLLGCALFSSVFVSERFAWTSGWLPAIAALGVTLWMGAPPLALGVTLAGAAVALTKFQALYNSVMVGGNEYSMSTRLVAWQLVGEIIKVSPIVGVGPANYYKYTPLFPILGYAVQFNSHNNYIDILAEVGLLGMLCYLWFMYANGRLGWRLKSKVPDGFAKAYVYGALGGLAGTLTAGMLGDWVIPFVYNIGYSGFRSSVLSWVFLGGLVVLERLYATPEENKQ